MATPLLMTKLYILPVRPGLVPSLRLVRRLYARFVFRPRGRRVVA